MNEATKRFFARLYLEQAKSDDYLAWAIACLEDGFDSKNLRMLASTEKPFYPSDVKDRFRRSLNELGWSYPSRKESLLSYAKELAGEIVTGNLYPPAGCNQIYKIALTLEYPDELTEWIYLDDGINPENYETIADIDNYPAIETPKWIDAIIRQAKKLAETNFS
jgi:hypothetical protein